MPKIINNLQETILSEAKEEVITNGYSMMAMRSVAKRCGIAVGTLYNYYSSKDDIIATILLREWNLAYEKMQQSSLASSSLKDSLKYIYQEIITFSSSYSCIFKEKKAIESFYTVYPLYHEKLRSQIAVLVNEITLKYLNSFPDFMPDFISEAIISWSGERKDFEEFYSVVCRLF